VVAAITIEGGTKMNTMKAPMPKCMTCACGSCADSEIGNMHALNSALDNAYSILGVGLVFFDGNKNVTHLNDQARLRLRLPEEFIVTGGDLFSMSFSAKIQARLKAAFDDLYTNTIEGEVHIDASIGGVSVIVMLQRLEKTAFGINSAGVAMFIFDDKRENKVVSADVASIFGLTKTEARLTMAIASGMTATEYSIKYGILVNTVYGQIKDILSKTGTRRQAELVKLVMEHAPGFKRPDRRESKIIPIVTPLRRAH